jgi:hypothetical protein
MHYLCRPGLKPGPEREYLIFYEVSLILHESRIVHPEVVLDAEVALCGGAGGAIGEKFAAILASSIDFRLIYLARLPCRSVLRRLLPTAFAFVLGVAVGCPDAKGAHVVELSI